VEVLVGFVTRAIGTVVLAGVAVGVLWWVTGGRVPLPEALASRLPTPRGADSMSTARSAALTRAQWRSIDDADFEAANALLATLTDPGARGAREVTLRPAQLLAFLVAPFREQLPPSARAAQIAVSDGRVYVKADVPLGDLGAGSALASLVGALDRRDTVIIGGRFEVVDGPNAQFLIEEVVLGEFSVPRPLVPRLIATMRRGRMPEWVAPHGYPVTLPASVGDVRVGDDRITVYRADPAPR
jgi:hypothetical protein